MEKNDLTKLLSIFGKELRDDFFSKKIFLYLCNNMIFFHIKSDTYFSNEVSGSYNLSKMDTARVLCDYVNNHYFRNLDKYDLLRDIYKYDVSSGNISSKKAFGLGGLVPIDIDESINGFIIVKNTSDNIEYIRSISRDNKLNKIINNEL